MKEDFLHYVWQHVPLASNSFTADNGDNITIINKGIKNNDAGPDFTNAIVDINGVHWAGNIEIHINSNDWFNHKHHLDEAYNNVVLHVVLNVQDRSIINKAERCIPQIALTIPLHITSNYNSLTHSNSAIACSNKLASVDDFHIKLWTEKLAIERLEQKTSTIQKLLESTQNNWSETFYILLARNFGFSTNAEPFEALALQTPLNILSKFKSNLFQLESLLFGQSGLLQLNDTNVYAQKLFTEYQFLQHKHKLKPLAASYWKFMRIRPNNFPTVRIAQFAALVNQSQHLFSRIIECVNIKEVKELFKCKVSTYWTAHYNFGKAVDKNAANLGKSSIENILINTVVPFIFIYGKLRGKEDRCDFALKLLESIAPEKNSIIKEWQELGIKALNARETQSLIQLRKQYCDVQKCIYCNIGHQVITNI